jgi:hypothetical protein
MNTIDKCFQKIILEIPHDVTILAYFYHPHDDIPIIKMYPYCNTINLINIDFVLLLDYENNYKVIIGGFYKYIDNDDPITYENNVYYEEIANIPFKDKNNAIKEFYTCVPHHYHFDVVYYNGADVETIEQFKSDGYSYDNEHKNFYKIDDNIIYGELFVINEEITKEIFKNYTIK